MSSDQHDGAGAVSGRPHVLIINPNSTTSMTEGLAHLIEEQRATCALKFTYFTPSTGPSSINDDADAKQSLHHCQKELTASILSKYDAFVVACYSDHPLVDWLREQVPSPSSTSGSAASKPVLGIFQASIIKSLQLIRQDQSFGIVSTGKVWEKLLTKGVEKMARRPWHDDDEQDDPDGERLLSAFAGVETTGLNATELHDAPQELVRRRMEDAVRRLVRRDLDGSSGEVPMDQEQGQGSERAGTAAGGMRTAVGAICLGCAGMAGMDRMVRKACLDELGAQGDEIYIVDGVLAAVDLLAVKLRR